MSDADATYSRKGFLQVLAFSAVLAGIGGLMTFITAPETLTCSKAGGRTTADCELVRSVLGEVPVKRIRIDGLESARIETFQRRRAIGDSSRDNKPSHRLRLVGGSGTYLAVQSSFEDLDDVRDEIEVMLAAPEAASLQTVVAGKPRVHRWSAAGLALGLSLLPLWILGYYFPALRPRPSRETA